jgi:uncharacterized protein (DUF1015 family)
LTRSFAASRPTSRCSISSRPDGVHHEIWQVPAGENQAIVDAFAKIDALYIADGHHRAARRHARGAASLEGRRRARSRLAVAFPDNQMQVLPTTASSRISTA